MELKCNTSLIDASIWVVTQNKIGLFQVEPSNRYNINSDLRISGLEIADEEYYACGYLDNGNNFVTISTYFVFVKGKKTSKSIQFILINIFCSTTILKNASRFSNP